MARRRPTREWRDDIPRSFQYTPPPAPPERAARPQGVLRLIVSLLAHR